MSAVIIKILKLPNGWTEVYVDEQFAGDLEDAEDTVTETMKKVVDLLQIDNVEIVEEKK